MWLPGSWSFTGTPAPPWGLGRFMALESQHHRRAEISRVVNASDAEPGKRGSEEPHPGISRTGSSARQHVRGGRLSVRSTLAAGPSPVQGAGGHANLHQGRRPRPSLSLSVSLQTGGQAGGGTTPPHPTSQGPHPTSWGPHPTSPHLLGTSPILVLPSLGPHFLPMSYPPSAPLSSATDCPHVHAWVQPLPSFQAKRSSPRNGLILISVLPLGLSDKKSLNPGADFDVDRKESFSEAFSPPDGCRPMSRDRRASPVGRVGLPSHP